ncbi:hypothetical protein CKM354_000924400 [Cercospora kikuchii]|uniref:Uncharacterized protein n=1 Tax=Cercospora kikuchii TaxID=84275 RepID=A0A9P3CUS4_9PEZI|nr:uncharacterized protein CKM354_000924400 [Cercospora kikuchii]GIZ46105.1 hypothetical protein CKM354_000924400 [Cercospora kikuchii]
MWSEQGVRVELRSVADDGIMEEHTNHHFQFPGGVTTSRLISGASGKAFKVCLEFDPEFRQYTANALKVEIVCNSAGADSITTSQCYAIPLSRKHGGCHVTFDKWIRWNHTKPLPELDCTNNAYTLPVPMNKEEPCAGDEWTRDYGVANKGSVVINIIRGKLTLDRVGTDYDVRNPLVPAIPPENIVETQPFAIDETWFQHLNSENCPVLFAEYKNVQAIEGKPDIVNANTMVLGADDGSDGSLHELDTSVALTDNAEPLAEYHRAQGPPVSSEGYPTQKDRPRRSKRNLNYALSDCSDSPSPKRTRTRRTLGHRKHPRVVHSESPPPEQACGPSRRRDEREASATPTKTTSIGLQDRGTRIKAEPRDSDDDCRFIEARAVTQNGPVTPRPTPSVISHGVCAHGTEGTAAAQAQIFVASSKQRKRAKLQLELETSFIRQKAALARIDAEAEFALQQKAIEKQLAELDEE